MSGNEKSLDWDKIKQRIKASETAFLQGLLVDNERLQAIFRQRAVRLANRRASDSTAAVLQPVLTFRLGNEEYSLELNCVAEILPQGHTTPVPGLGREFVGVFNLHGAIRPLVNLRHVLGLAAPENEDSGYIVVLRQKQMELAVQVEQLEQVTGIDVENLSKPDKKEEDNSSFQFIKGVTPEALLVLSADELFAQFVFQK